MILHAFHQKKFDYFHRYILFQVIVDCDNTHGDVNMSCPEYSYQIGTKFDEEISEADPIVQEELESQLWKMFNDSSVWTSSTSYDWGQISDDAKVQISDDGRMSKNGEQKVKAVPESFVPPGRLY